MRKKRLLDHLCMAAVLSSGTAAEVAAWGSNFIGLDAVADLTHRVGRFRSQFYGWHQLVAPLGILRNAGGFSHLACRGEQN